MILADARQRVQALASELRAKSPMAVRVYATPDLIEALDLVLSDLDLVAALEQQLAQAETDFAQQLDLERAEAEQQLAAAREAFAAHCIQCPQCHASLATLRPQGEQSGGPFDHMSNEELDEFVADIYAQRRAQNRPQGEQKNDQARFDQPQLRASESDPRGDVVPMCGNCRFHETDEQGGGRNKCLVLDGESERYKYAVNHTCDTKDEQQAPAFQPNYWKLDGILEDLIGAAPTRPQGEPPDQEKDPEQSLETLLDAIGADARPICAKHKTPKRAHYYCLACRVAGDNTVNIQEHGEPPERMTDDGAGLIGQAIPDMVGTEPRPNSKEESR